MNYFYYRKKGFGRGVSMNLALGDNWASIVIHFILWLLLGVLSGLAIIYGVSYMSSKQKEARTEQAEYVANLEKMLATCLTAGSHAIWIGDELHFCGAYNAGEKRKS